MKVKLMQGDCLTALDRIPARTVQCCITSPPYWGQRDYDCDDAQLGCEALPEVYVNRLVERLMKVRRVLKRDGVLWLNIGDVYITNFPSGVKRESSWWSNKSGRKAVSIHALEARIPGNSQRKTLYGLKPKNLCGIPWRVAFELQKAGWFLRSEIIWNKGIIGERSKYGRPTRSHEHLFMFTMSANYLFYEDEFSRLEPYVKNTIWPIPRAGRGVAHCAVFPSALVLPCIRLTTREGDCVLDPFAGSGTVGKVAVHEKRDAILIDYSKSYVDAMAKDFAKGRGGSG